MIYGLSHLFLSIWSVTWHKKISWMILCFWLCLLSFSPFSMVDEQRSNEIMDSLRNYLTTLPFDFKKASIISGQEEGLYGWVTVNYLMGNFLEVKFSHCSVWVKSVITSPICSNTSDAIHVHCRKTCGTLTFGPMARRPSAPWTSGEPPHRSPSQSRTNGPVRTTCTLNCTATPTTFTHTASSATAKTRLRRWFWMPLCR